MVQIQDILPDSLGTLKFHHVVPVCVDCGLMAYQEALELQVRLHEAVLTGSMPSVILLVEHPPVITLGLHKEHNILVLPQKRLDDLGIDVVQVRRGGGGTVHNPGQLVVYPIIKLQDFGFHVAPFVHYLEQIAMDVLQHSGVPSGRRNRYPGLWVEGRKIASVGIQIARGVSMHGIAINLYNDLGIFGHIVPCGIDGVEMTSAAREGAHDVPMRQLKEVVQSSCVSLIPEFVGPRRVST
ncbi:MAG: lipoyl(octanoyl) transferase [Spirochaetae bacterium HGW-Spirochaetae-2]|jgi:lipoate-protein ligase B|nr:MAG: lipoyl(octanoyl) transferase [Spirochaetae bacterium HGW-Spirochaetae-2]